MNIYNELLKKLNVSHGFLGDYDTSVIQVRNLLGILPQLCHFPISQSRAYVLLVPEAKVTPRLITNSDVLHFKIEALVDNDGTKKNQLLYTWISYPE